MIWNTAWWLEQPQLWGWICMLTDSLHMVERSGFKPSVATKTLILACHAGTLGNNEIIQLMNEIPVTMRTTDTVACRLPIIYKCASSASMDAHVCTLLHAGSQR